MQERSLADVRTPFALFEGPVAHVADSVGEARCSLCGRVGFCLELSIGYDLIAPCSSCGALMGFSAVGDPERCVSCDTRAALASTEDDPACLTCLKDGRFAITKDSDVGMVRWRDAIAGTTHGLPIAPNADGTPVTTYLGLPAEPSTSEGWYRIRVASEILLSLVLTPDFDSIQASVWKFHCGQPMVFIGRWGKADFAHHAPDGDGASFARAIADMDADAFEDLDDSGDGEDAVVWAYAFRCAVCEVVAAYWDVD